DQGKLYPAFDMEFALGMRDLCKLADIIVPNITEACFMLEKPYPGEDYDQAYIEDLLRELAALGPGQVILTGVSFESDKIGAAAYNSEADSTDYYFTERIEGYYHGTGDIYSSALLAAVMNDKSLPESIRIACDFTVAAIRRTHDAGTDPKYGVEFERELGTLIKMLG
ncbi:MAG TPA: pyridoxal kinase, partial [Coriobacteriia bacterium]|nr:pyridoxal kinase [Coriobacteriia bacterium]